MSSEAQMRIPQTIKRYEHVHKFYAQVLKTIQNIISQEKAPENVLSDYDLQQELAERYNLDVDRKTVCDIRAANDIPNSFARKYLLKNKRKAGK